MNYPQDIVGTRDSSGCFLCTRAKWTLKGLQLTEVADLSGWTKKEREELYPTIGEWIQ